MRGATVGKSCYNGYIQHFNPRAPCGARRWVGSQRSYSSLFQSARPVRGATRYSDSHGRKSEFQSARPVRGATHRRRESPESGYISIRAPRAGRDLLLGAASVKLCLFQSARPVRGATPVNPDRFSSPLRFQSARPVRGATIIRVSDRDISDSISIRAPRAGRDQKPSP